MACTPDDHDATQEPRQHAGVPLPVYGTVANGPAILALTPPTAASLVAWAHQIPPAWLDEPPEREPSRDFR
ncbi:hypothetical protein [Candidatus Chloroploca asiatica]|uniref:hypothetical protein n=1 Tax=Candidatus Chloroploca asiatica TaxID=1506545 RepID=UPI000BE8C4B7|nr:hypothetical protein [Candidatus Chloroploca asiatica]